MEIIDEETGFNDKTYEMQLKKVRHLRIPEKPDILMTSQERIQKELEKKTKYKDLTKEEADTMVCDGAKLNLFSFSYNLKIYYENKKIKNVYEKTILKMDNDLELTEKVKVKDKEKE
ncbi:hypothetical protein JMUB4039_0827 [Leptotrichia trevisanii]|uniref:hypothetical protein n=1 Tax=Leptotrichia trevisanii TaxID=109328 RepID=UPI00118D2C3F|nr:hypothetical protein [Leptotrichia trevisanii]BBM56849.1 hypothetical protein JMUB4039_0827 [Leptotrichia trevisanii]